MINIKEINRTIAELEQHDTTYSTCEKLAWLYTVKDHLRNEGTAPKIQNEAVPVQDESEFLRACAGVSIEKILHVFDKHMNELRLLFPREYSVIIDKIKSK